jgi:HSP20 family protein
MSVSRWDPFQDLLAIQDEMNQLFGRAVGQGGQARGQGQVAERMWAPALDISERKDAYVVTVEVPGIKADDLDITLEDGLLTIKGERRFTQESTEQQFHRVERRYGSFRRSITLPAQVQADRIEASFEDGVLQVVVPKAEEAKPKKISVRAGGGREQVEGTSTPASEA